MKLFGKNVGRHDAESREVAALLLVAGGVTALSVVHDGMAWLVWLLGATMVVLGTRYIWLGMKGCGTWLFGAILSVFGVVVVALASAGAGFAAFVIGVALAVIGWVTAAAGRCPVNALLGLNTRDDSPAAGGATLPQPVRH